MTGPRVFFYVQHLQGVGHLYRASRIATRMIAAGLDVVLVSGGKAVPGLDAGGARLHQLPPVQCPDGDFRTLRGPDGVPIDAAYQNARRDALLAIFDECRPAAVVIEAYPFGRRRMAFELLPLLDAAKALSPKPLVVCSVRDILQQDPKPQRVVESVETFNAYFDAALVHGDPGFAAFEETFPATAGLKGDLHYTGIVGPPSVPEQEGGGEVVVSAGGGATESERLLAAAMEARALSELEDRPWRLLAGPNLPPGELDRLRAGVPEGIVLEPNRGDFLALLASAAVSVSQAGYNTVAEVLRAGCRSVVVPYAGGGETEQTFRARRLHERGLAHMVADTDLAPDTLAAAVDAAFRAPRPQAGAVDLEGADKSARLVASWIGG